MPIVAAYAILMKARNEKLSAWHRLTTMVAVKGHLDDSALTRFNHLGVMLCTTSKIRLLEEAGESMEKNIARELVNNPLVKITGDNLDIYIKTGHRSLDRSNKDLHLFASNIIFSRIAKPGIYSTSVRHTPLERIRPEMFFPTGHHRQTLVNSYCVILGRILVTLKEFSWLGPVLPAHIYHPFQVHMSQKSSVYQLPIIMKNEAKHEDCVDILDTYETILSDIYVKAFGSTELLNKFQVPVGGDQLTRVRLEEAKNLRTLATTPRKRFEDLQPFVIELWHTKQDYLEKCYKELFMGKSLRQSGTLYHYKSKLQRKEVNGKVKGAFKTHHEFLLLVGQQMIIEQFLEYFGMESASSSPTKNVPSFKRSLSERRAQMQEMLTDFMRQYGYLEFVHDVRVSDDDDYVFNYCCNLCRWVLHLLMFEDIVREGDISRLIPCLMVCLQFFFSHSRLSKYFQEMLDFILKCEFLLSPMQRVRALEGAFTNLRGGMGKNIESDLVQENSVCNQKDLIRSLGANKTDKAILRCTKAADTIEKISSYVDSVASQKKSSKHHVPKAVKDQEIIQRSLRQLRPFNKTPGRSCDGFPKICRSPLKKINKNDFQYRIMQVVSRLYYGQSCSNVNQCSDEDE
ncbi:uncharacterized protein LOC128550851 isoform X2 [Mercenaria mercenaria]|uniref:uncharacterized protein LOC128550851 isoform X2 n=1 Tax=Mercenaria mercenaria TaxID=6596 RepID=UPI00234FA521|nr:uncharacterized protein LOC128550851 isoform X2 [Mercenaria mercenaria]